jgi:hypothetical protein
MKSVILRIFLYSAGVLLLVTALAKIVSALGSARVLQNPEPILGVPFRTVFWIVGALEFMVALVCFFGRRLTVQAGLVAWLATNFVVYRLGLLWIGYHKPCGCLGNLTDALHVSPQTVDTAMKIILAYLLVGSYGALYWLWRQNRATPLPAPSSETGVTAG